MRFGRSKFNARRTQDRIDGFWHASDGQAKLWEQRRMEEKAGEIKDLKREVNIPLIVNGLKICTYRADHTYTRVKEGSLIVEDFKGVLTDVYKLKKKLVKAIHGIDILEIKKR